MTNQQLAPACFDDQVLADFNTGRLADETVVEQVAAHLSVCERCDSRLSSLPEDPLVTLLRAPDPLRSLTDTGELSVTYSLAPSRPPGDEPVQADVRKQDGTGAKDGGELPIRIDRYFVVRLLGKGGFAQVFLAKDPDHNRLVAIKTPHFKRLSSHKQRESFLHEARTVATLEHPNIVPMYDCRELADGHCIVVMKYIEGATLREAIKSRRIGAREAAEIVVGIADALNHAHRRSIWHRDVKPANILLDATGKPYLADFGLALHEQQASQEHEVAGTYDYMSPEQTRGQTTHLDGRTDIWSLGVTLYELLSRQRPFRGARPEQITADIQTHAHRPLLSIDPTIPKPLAEICEKCLRKNAAERYQTVDDLANDLRAFLGRASRRRRMMILVAAVAALLLGAVALLRPFGDKPAAVATGLAPASQESEAGFLLDQTDTWQPLLDHRPVESSWIHMYNNAYTLDRDQGRLFMRHEGRGFLSMGELGSASFQVRFVQTFDDWRTGGGFFWAMQPDPNVFPQPKPRCLVLFAKRFRDEPVLRLTMDAMDFDPWPFDNKKFVCNSTHTYATAKIDLPASKVMAFHLTVKEGKLEEIRLNNQLISLKWGGPQVPWGNVIPSGCGFMVFNGVVTYENASLLIEEPENGEERQEGKEERQEG